MAKALEKAGKEVQLHIVREEGHSMLESENRLAMLQQVYDFVDAEIGSFAP